MRTSLVIATYNWESALYLCLKSVLAQTKMPDEVIIADDGSKIATTELINKMRSEFPCPLKHIWQEDNGFQLAKIRNKAFAACESEYVIQIDGDIILHPKFIEDHLSVAEECFFIAGGRVKLNESLSKRLLEDGQCEISLFTKGVKRKLNGLRVPCITPFFYNYKHDRIYGRGCNMAFWRNDLYAVNGYDEAFIAYGFEDFDLMSRLNRNNVRRRFLKFKGIEYHIYHREHDSKNDMGINQNIYEGHNSDQIIECEKGISQYMNE